MQELDKAHTAAVQDESRLQCSAAPGWGGGHIQVCASGSAGPIHCSQGRVPTLGDCDVRDFAGACIHTLNYDGIVCTHMHAQPITPLAVVQARSQIVDGYVKAKEDVIHNLARYGLMHM